VDTLCLIARLLLAGVFVVSGLAKLSDRKGTRQALIDFRLPRRLASPTSLALPVVEIVIAIALVPAASGWWGALAAFALLVLITAAIGINLAKGRRPLCHCFGQLDSSPIGWQTLARNGVFAAIAGLILSQARTPSLQIALFAAAGVVFAGALVGEGWLIYRLGRRLASLEKKLATVGFALSPEAGNSTTGLAVGARAPGFRLDALDGETITLDRLCSAGKPVLLVFTDPECGPCTQLLPTLGNWQLEHAAHLAIVNISRGSLEANRAKSAAYGVKNLLVSSGGEVIQAYGAFAIPSAVLIRPDGTVGSTLALGEGAIGALIQKTLVSRQSVGVR
jgi:peroxiredoxin